MNYKLHYEKLISKAQNRCILKSEYKEVHHIIPRCMGGDNSKDNLVALFPEEHLLAHLMLAKIYTNIKGLVFAAFAMTCGFNKCGRITNKRYRWIREKHAIIQSEAISKERIQKRLSTMYANNTFTEMGKKISSSLLRIEENGETIAKNSTTRTIQKRKLDIDENGKNSFNRAGDKRVENARKIIDENGIDKITTASIKMAKTRSLKNESNESSYTLGAKKGSLTRTTTIEANGKTIAENAGIKLSQTLRTSMHSSGVSYIEYRSMLSAGSNNPMAIRCNIMNADHEIMFECNGNIKSICLQHNIPLTIRYTTKENFLYKKLKGITKQKYLENGNYFYYGWYVERV